MTAARAAGGSQVPSSRAGHLTLRLWARVDDWPVETSGHQAPLTSIAPLQARLLLGAPVSGAPSITADLSWPRALPRAEVRWLVDKVRRQLAKTFSLGTATLETSEIDSETEFTLALDLHHAFGGAVTSPSRIAAEVRRVGAAEDRYREWINEDPCDRTSIAIARDVVDWAQSRAEVAVEVLETERLRAEGLNLLVAVGGASVDSPPRLVIARYVPVGADPAKALMILGKGVTFDTGGINVKPYESFVSMMKNDMGGAALAWALFSTLVEAGHKRPLTLVIPTCDNPVGEGAMRPGSIVKSHRGHSVRIDHTDAEGRLILADALSYATDPSCQATVPESVLCFATLTTASLRSYGPYATPVHFAQSPLETALASASESTGEDLHFFPRRVWHAEANKDEEADLKNTARLPSHASIGAGSRNAAHFLLNFTDIPLVHFDIFACTWNWAGDAPGAGYGATGAPLRTVLRALEASAV